MISVQDKQMAITVEAEVAKTKDYSQQLRTCDAIVMLWSSDRLAVVCHYLFLLHVCHPVRALH